MKKVEAFIKNHRLDEVIGELHEIDGLTGISFFEIKGFGRIRDDDSGKNHVDDNPLNESGHIKLEMFCLDETVEKVVCTIQKAAHTGLRGDGKIYVLEVNEAIRVSSNERGSKAC